MTTHPNTIRLLPLIEASSITGPAKNLLTLCVNLSRGYLEDPSLEPVNSTLITFCRGRKTAVEEFSSPRAAAEAPNPFVATACELGLTINVIGEGFRYDPRVIPQLRRVVEENGPAIVETHSVKSHFLLRMSGLWREHPWLAFHHGYTATDAKVAAYNKLDRWSLRVAAGVVTVCRAFADQLRDIGIPAEKIRIIHNSVDTKWYDQVDRARIQRLRESLGVANGERMILTAGRLSHEKAHIDLVSAVAELRKTHPEIQPRLVILGEGPERPAIERRAKELGLQDRLLLAGHVDNVKDYLVAADLFALPSLSEGSPNAMLEAMSAARPIVTTAVGGVPEIVSHNETAWMTPSRDPAAMAQGIGALLANPAAATAMGARARALAIRQYSPQARLRHLIEIYREFAPARVSARP